MINYEENRKQDISLTEVITSLKPIFPDLRRKQIKFIYHGSYNVFEVKEKYIFRFPDKIFRNSAGAKLITNEVRMLNIIKNYVDFNIPDPIFISTEEDNLFIGYEMLKGISLSKCFMRATKSNKIGISKDIGSFLSQLHSDELKAELIVDSTNDLKFTTKYIEDWKKFYKDIQKKAFSLTNSTQKIWIINLFDSFLNNKENFNFIPTVVHGDFDISNILVNSGTFDVTGIIDFEESRIYDPAVDLLFYNEGDLFLRNILANYQRQIDSHLEVRMKFLFGCTCLHYIKFGIEHNINDMIKVGFKKLKYIMKIFSTL
ncbi:MAG: phosphotransferase family protein [Promethearchaeota archaeon]